MRTKAKRWSMFMTVVLSLSMILSACGGKTGGSTASGSDSKSDKPVNLIWYTVGQPQKDMPKVLEEVNKYLKEKINATIDVKMIDYGDYTQKMQVMAASGEPMDILFTSSWAFDYVQNARKGAFVELDDLIEKYGQDLKKAIDPEFLIGSKVDGHNYAIPANKELPAQEAWRFNKTLADKYKFDITKATTLDSIEPMLKTIKENEPGITPFAINKDYVPVLPIDFVIQNFPLGMYLDSKDHKIINVLETPELKKALETMHKYYKAGYVSPESASISSNEDLYKSGKFFMDRAATQPFADNIWTASYGMPIESTPAGPPTIFNWSVMGSMQAISANSENPEKAMEFLNLLNTDPKLRNMMDSGIEGVHYKMVGDNVMENLPAAKDYDMPSFSLGNLMIMNLMSGDPTNKWDEFKKFNASGQPGPLLGFNFDSSKVTNEIAAVQNARAEFWSALMTGTVDPDVYLPKAIEKMKAAGLDKIQTEVQTQYDAWYAENNKK